jgi:D-serine deaminase-like pyridoxal phosphate-dependent protein
VLVEVDCGMHRSGASASELGPVVRAALDAGLDVRGAFTFGGHGYATCDAPTGAADDEVSALTWAASMLRDEGVDVRVLSAGSTPTALRSARAPVTEERPGTYVFQDRQQLTLGTAGLEDVALVVAATVVASHGDGRIVLDAGSKVLSSDRPAWLTGFGLLPAYPDAEVRSLSEHHAVAWTTGSRPRVGEVVAVVPNHCCVVVNLADSLIAVQAGVVVDRWPLLSRGRNG